VLSSAQATTARVAVVDESGGPAGTIVASRLQSALDGQPGIALDRSVADDATARQMLKDKKLDLVVILPADFTVQNRKIELLTLGLNPTGEASVIPAVQAALIGALADSAGAMLQRSNGKPSTARRMRPSSTAWRRWSSASSPTSSSSS